MKITTIILMMLLAVTLFGESTQNGVYIQNGKTIEIDLKVPHAYYSVNTTNNSSIIYFSNGLTSKIETNSQFIIDGFTQEIFNTNSYPEKAKLGASMLNVSLMNGIAYFIYPEDDTNSTCVVSTPLTDIELHRGSFYFVVNENTILALVIHGSLTAYGDKKEKKDVLAGDTLIAIPNKIGILDAKISLSTQYIREPVLNKLKSVTKEISTIKNGIIFIRIDEKTLGVSL